MTSPQTSRRGAFVAPVLLFVALLGGAMFFGLLAMSGKYEKDVKADQAAAAVAGPPSKAVPAAKTIVTNDPSRSPRATANPPETHTPEPSATPQSGNGSEDAREIAALPRKPIPGRTAYPVLGGYCTPAGSKARTAAGDVVVCGSSAKGGTEGSSAKDDKNRWREADDN
ncbi:hypothetical protein ACIA5D_25265 [Actinoplanes sp. NPDC051513]|uniref:hypothetical protein n=1 Tax=Actinoplanes sp. NPDC051513 TaxID=3363908 RepID=UPI00379A39C7